MLNPEQIIDLLDLCITILQSLPADHVRDAVFSPFEPLLFAYFVPMLIKREIQDEPTHCLMEKLNKRRYYIIQLVGLEFGAERVTSPVLAYIIRFHTPAVLMTKGKAQKLHRTWISSAKSEFLGDLVGSFVLGWSSISDRVLWLVPSLTHSSAGWPWNISTSVT